MYLIVSIMALLVILILTGKKSVHSEITINANSEKVWEVLTDMKTYPEWNPTMQLIEGDVKEGGKVTYQFTQDANTVSNIGAKVLEIIPNQLLNQKGGIPAVLTFNHKYILEPAGATTVVTIHEDYKGIGVHFWNPEPVEKAYQRLNKALKTRVEAK